MRFSRWAIACGVLLSGGCSSTAGSVAADDVQAYCALTTEIEETMDAANDRALSADADQLVEERIAALWPMVPRDHSDDFRLRYWPKTDVSGLDTSGVSAQAAYDRMAILFDETCGPS